MLSGDDPLTVAAMAVGGRGVVSVASNEAPAEMVQIVELCEKGDFAAARKLHHWLLPLLQVNFVETNPIPCKAAMAAMGLIEENYRLPMVPPSAAARDKIIGVLQQLKMLGAAARVYRLTPLAARRIDGSLAAVDPVFAHPQSGRHRFHNRPRGRGWRVAGRASCRARLSGHGAAGVERPLQRLRHGSIRRREWSSPRTSTACRRSFPAARSAG